MAWARSTQGGPGVPPKRPFGVIFDPKTAPKNSNITLSSLRLIGRLIDILYTRDQGLSKYAYIVGNGVDYPEIWSGQGPPRGVRGYRQKSHFGVILDQNRTQKNANFTLSSLRLIGRLSDVLYTRDQGLSKYTPILSGMELTTLRYGLGMVNPEGSGGTAEKAIWGHF